MPTCLLNIDQHEMSMKAKGLGGFWANNLNIFDVLEGLVIVM
jgi:hypothetical protein